MADVSNTEQLSLVLRFVNESNDIREEFVDFLPCMDGTSGQAIAGMILDRLREFKLDPAFILGRGKTELGTCLASCGDVQHSFPGLVPEHCYSHILNLCIAEACDVQVVRNWDP